MGSRLLPRNLPELYAHSLAIEREATKRFAELEQRMRELGAERLADELGKIGKEEKEQYELLALGTAGRALPELENWEYAWHYLGAAADRVALPESAREALGLALATELRTQLFYADVAEWAADGTVRAFAAEMAADEQRHVARLELLLACEPDPAAPAEDGALLA